MSTGPRSSDTLHDRANDLYWNSEESVTRLAEELGVARNTVYAAVEPAPTGLSCPDCGGALVFTNRTQRASGTATCPTCETEISVEDVPAATGTGAGSGVDRSGPANIKPVASTDLGDRPNRVERLKEDLSAVPPERAALIGGAAALGVAVGAVATKIARKK